MRPGLRCCMALAQPSSFQVSLVDSSKMCGRFPLDSLLNTDSKAKSYTPPSTFLSRSAHFSLSMNQVSQPFLSHESSQQHFADLVPQALLFLNKKTNCFRNPITNLFSYHNTLLMSSIILRYGNIILNVTSAAKSLVSLTFNDADDWILRLVATKIYA